MRGDSPPVKNGTAPHPPKTSPVIAENVPEFLRALNRWVGWRWILRGGKPDKPPFNVKTGELASSTNPETWCSFDEAHAAHQEGRFDGIGVTLGKLPDGRTLAGFDLDKDCWDEAGTLTASAAYLLGILDTYTERSPSGRGAKALCFGTLPPGKHKDDARGVELYDSGRYFCVTGRRLEQFPADVMDRAAQLADLHGTLFRESTTAHGATSQDDHARALAALAQLSPSRADNYGDWIAVGMALRSVSDDLLGAWDEWSRSSPKWQDGVCARKWASFKSGGLTLGSLIHWAEQDSGRPGGKAPQGAVASATAAGPKKGREIIYEWLGPHYQACFRRGTSIVTASGEVARQEAVGDMPLELLEPLKNAVDAPRDDNGVKESAIPYFFRTWAGTAWREYLSELPREEEAAAKGQAGEMAEEEFRTFAAGMLHAMPSCLSRQHESSRSVIGYCRHTCERADVVAAQAEKSARDFEQMAQDAEDAHKAGRDRGLWDADDHSRVAAVRKARFSADLARKDADEKHGRYRDWSQVGSLNVWFRRGECATIEIAIRPELAAQLHCRELAKLKPKRFTRLCGVYGVWDGKESRVAGRRVLLLKREFLEEHLGKRALEKEGEK